MKVPKVTSFFLIFFLASLLAQARRLQDNYEAKSTNGKLPVAATSDFLLRLRLELPTSVSLQDSQSFLERFNAIVTYMTFMSSLSSKEFGREEPSPPPSPESSDPQNPTIITSSLSSDGELGKGAASPPPSPKPSDPQNPTVISSSLSSGEFGREGKSPPPAPKPLNPDHPTIIINSSYGRPATSPPPAPKPGTPIHPGNSGGGEVISMADDLSENPSFVASA